MPEGEELKPAEPPEEVPAAEIAADIPEAEVVPEAEAAPPPPPPPLTRDGYEALREKLRQKFH